MFVDSRFEEPTQWSSSEASAALLQKMDRGDMVRTTSLFDDALSERTRRVHWLSSGAEPVEACCRQTLFADLLVLGQHDLSARRQEPCRRTSSSRWSWPAASLC